VNLSQLIATQKQGRTYAQLEVDCGGFPSSKRLQQLATQVQKNFPDPVTIKALARGLRVTEVAVVLSSAESLGLDVGRATPTVLDYLPPGVNDLDDDQLFAIGNLIRSFMPPEQQDEPTPAETALAAEVTLNVWGPDESETPSPDQPVVDHILRDRDELEIEYEQIAARDVDVHGQPIRSRGRELRRDQDAAGEGSQDPGNDDPA